VMEAVMHGLPVIVPPWAGVTEVLPSATTCDPGDAGALGGAMVALLEDPGRSEWLVRRAQAEALRRPWRAAAEQCGEIYRSAAMDAGSALRGAAPAGFG
jgi:glycosyltransferase involved in cell wall biosynthesis